jgi:hypothetical protein
MASDSEIFTVEFWKATGTRALRTFAQGMLGAIGTGAVAPNILSVDWTSAICIGLGASVVSVMMAVAYPNGIKEAHE